MASSSSIGSKIGIGFGSAITTWILAAAGYAKDGQITDKIVNAIRFDYGWLGAILTVFLIIAVLCMDVEKYLPQIRKELDK